MSNPARAPQEQLVLSCGLVFPEAYLAYSDDSEYIRLRGRGKDIGYIKEMLRGANLEIKPSFYLDPQLSADPTVKRAAKKIFARAETKQATARLRSGPASRMVQSIYPLLPSGGLANQIEFCAMAMRNKVVMDAGTQFTLGRLRLALPRLHTPKQRRYLVPITQREADAALRACGQDMLKVPSALRKPLFLGKGESEIRVNPKSSNGLPVGLKWENEETHDQVWSLVVDMRERMRRAQLTPGGIWGLVRFLEERRPELVTFVGKAKADGYSLSKIDRGMLRFYNVVPRHLMLIMQTVTQQYEKYSRNILNEDDGNFTTAQGVSLVRGGAAHLVTMMDQELASQSLHSPYGWAHVHVGDDSWIAMRSRWGTLMFSLDCSNFDLTQDGKVTEALHEAMGGMLSCFDDSAADLWYALIRERQVLTAGTLVYKWVDGGASGMPLQSKVNDALMEVLIMRLQEGLGNVGDMPPWKHAPPSRELLEEKIAEAGRSMGFTVRLEDYELVENVHTLRQALAVRPFLFVGYYFHTLRGEVTVHCDVARTLAQIPYPALRWEKQDRAFRVQEAIRLGSITLNLGLPTVALQPAFDAARAYARAYVLRTIQEVGDVSDPALRWGVLENPMGAETETSLSGLLRAMERPPELLWGSVGQALDVRLAEPPGTSWADQVDDAELENVRRLTLEEPIEIPLKARARRVVVPEHPLAHPATEANGGRPPPTARWAPDVPPRVIYAGGGESSRPRGRKNPQIARLERIMFGRELDSDSEDSEFDASIGDDISYGSA